MSMQEVKRLEAVWWRVRNKRCPWQMWHVKAVNAARAIGVVLSQESRLFAKDLEAEVMRG